MEAKLARETKQAPFLLNLFINGNETWHTTSA